MKTNRAFGTAPRSLTRRVLILAGLASAAPAALASQAGRNNPPAPPEVLGLAREWVALVDRANALHAGGGNAGTLYEDARVLNDRLTAAMKAAGLGPVAVGRRVVVNSWEAGSIPTASAEFSAVVIDLDEIAGL